MKFLRGLLCLIFVDLALDPLKKRIEEIAGKPPVRPVIES